MILILPITETLQSGKAHLWTKFGRTAFGRLKQTAVGSIRKELGYDIYVFFEKKCFQTGLPPGNE